MARNLHEAPLNVHKEVARKRMVAWNVFVGPTGHSQGRGSGAGTDHRHGAPGARHVVRTEQVAVPVELRREEVHVERVPASGTEVPADAFQERDIEVTTMREEPVVSKEAQVTGEVRVDKSAQTETRTVGGEVRKEDVEVDEGGETGGP